MARKSISKAKVKRVLDDAPLRVETSHGFRAWSGSVRNMVVAHTHTDIEFNFVLKGHLRYFIAGRFEEVAAGKLALFWAGVPHRLIEARQPNEMIWLTIPLAWFLEWSLDEQFVHRLLGGEVVFETTAEMQKQDCASLPRWVGDFRQQSIERRRIAMLEIEARVRRLALSVGRAEPTPRDKHGADQVERMSAYIGRSYREPISIAQIADSVKLHPNYAMTLFKRSCGMSLWEYLTRLRVTHAQRLLLTTDWKVQRIALDAGFASPSRFYESFTRLVKQTPRQYRLAATL